LKRTVLPTATRHVLTYDLLEHSQNFNQKGNVLREITRRYEVIYIADLSYQHLLEINGKPLGGQDLADEQKRYEDAVRERTRWIQPPAPSS